MLLKLLNTASESIFAHLYVLQDTLHIFILYHGLGQMFLKLSMVDQPPPHAKASINIKKSTMQILSKLSSKALLVCENLFFIDATYLIFLTFCWCRGDQSRQNAAF